MVGFTGDFEFIMSSTDADLHYQFQRIKDGEDVNYQVKIYTCTRTKECNQESCPLKCDKETILFTTEPVFDSWEEAEEWGEKFKELFYCLLESSGRQHKIKLRIG
jgi:hypothetical protein